jgi:hypothetical protein
MLSEENHTMKRYLLRLTVAVVVFGCLVFSQYSTANALPYCLDLIAEGLVPASTTYSEPFYTFATPEEPVWIKLVTTNSNPAAWASAAIAISAPASGEPDFLGSVGTPTTTTWSYTSLPNRRVRVYGHGQVLPGVKGTLSWEVYLFHECD